MMSPTDFTTQNILKATWADPADPKQITNWPERQAKNISGSSFLPSDKFGFESSTGRPLNPQGRCGLRGRGSLSNWGPNFAADPLITRESPQTRNKQGQETRLQMLVVLRPEQRYGIPGFAIPPSKPPWGPKLEKAFEQVRKTMRKTHSDAVIESKIKEFDEQIAELARVGEARPPLYEGYSDDPRNTDNAWMVTACRHYHVDDVSDALNRSFDALNESEVSAWEGAQDVTVFWLDMDRIRESRYADLYAQHRFFSDRALHRLSPHQESRTDKYYNGSWQKHPIDRSYVDDEDVHWETSVPDYKPPYMNARKNSIDNETADGRMVEGTAEEFQSNDYRTLMLRGSYEEVMKFDPVTALPRNPHGRTGLRGMGHLFRWGPNHACDLVITRDNPYKGHLEMMLITRPDGTKAIPGKFIDVQNLSRTGLLKQMEQTFVEKCLKPKATAHRLADTKSKTDQPPSERSLTSQALKRRQRRDKDAGAGGEADKLTQLRSDAVKKAARGRV